MILAVLLMLQTASDPAALLDTRWAGTMRGAACRTRRSTGDAEIDRIGCAAMAACRPTYDSRYAATNDRAVRPEVRKVMRAALAGELVACERRERANGIAALAARRKGA